MSDTSEGMLYVAFNLGAQGYSIQWSLLVHQNKVSLPKPGRLAGPSQATSNDSTRPATLKSPPALLLTPLLTPQPLLQLIVAENQKLGAKPGATLAQFGTPEAVVNRVGNFITGTYLDEEDVLSAESKQLADGRTYYVYEVGACTGAWWQLAVCAGLVAACRQGDRQGQQAGGRGAGREGSRELSGRCLGTMLMTSSSRGMKQACPLLATLLTLCSPS